MVTAGAGLIEALEPRVFIETSNAFTAFKEPPVGEASGD
jgi:hypothetical protein